MAWFTSADARVKPKHPAPAIPSHWIAGPWQDPRVK